jgi:hypothetical protein
MLRITASGYDDLGRGRRALRQSANLVYEADKGNIDDAVFQKADECTDAIRTNVQSLTPSRPSMASVFQDFLDHLRTEATKEYPRRNATGMNNSRIAVALVSVEGASLYGQQSIEFGAGDFPAGAPMRTAVFEMGGDLA